MPQTQKILQARRSAATRPFSGKNDVRSQRQRFPNIMRHEHDSFPQSLLKAFKLPLQFRPVSPEPASNGSSISRMAGPPQLPAQSHHAAAATRKLLASFAQNSRLPADKVRHYHSPAIFSLFFANFPGRTSPTLSAR